METSIHKMKIVQIVPTLSTGGAEQFVVNLANELSKNHELTVITLFNTNQDIIKKRLDPHVSLLELQLPLNNKILAFAKLNKLLKLINPDVVHTHLSSPLYMLVYAFFMKKKCRFIHTVHNVAKFDAPRKINKMINMFYFKVCGATPVSITKKVSESVIEYYGIKRSTVIHNGTNVISPSDQYRLVIDKINHIKESHQFVLCHIARVDPQKNHKLLFEMLRRVPGCYVISMGAITRENENYANTILSESEKITNFEYIGVVSNVADYIAACDGLIFSSNYEGLPISLIESMSLGKICISTPAGGISDVLNDDIGLLSKGFNINDLTNVVEEFSSFDENRKKEFKTRIIEEYHKEYSVQNCAKSYYNIYKRPIL